MSRQKLSIISRENERLDAQVEDLGRQVTRLVREVEAARKGLNTSHYDEPDSLNISGGGAEGIISSRLVEFRDVAELQKRNMELLSVVR